MLALTLTTETLYKISIVDNLDDFQALKEEWNCFLARANVSLLCLRHEWLVACLKYFSFESLLILLVRNESGQLVSVLPLKISKGCSGIAGRLVRYLQFVGTDPCVYEQMQIPYLFEEDFYKIVDQMVLKLQQIHSKWDVLDLRYFSQKTQLDAFTEALFKQGYQPDVLPSMLEPYLLLPSELETYLQNRKNIIKKNINNMRNRLERDFFGQEVKLLFLTPDSKSLALMEGFFQCHTHYWRQQGARSDFERFPALKSFYKDLFLSASMNGMSDFFRFSVLTVGDKPISYEVGFWQERMYLHHLSSYDIEFKRYSPGTLHLEYLIQSTLQQGGRVFDLGRGDEPYKENWAQYKQELWNLLLVKGHTSAFLLKGDEALKHVYFRLRKLQRYD